MFFFEFVDITDRTLRTLCLKICIYFLFTVLIQFSWRFVTERNYEIFAIFIFNCCCRVIDFTLVHTWKRNCRINRTMITCWKLSMNETISARLWYMHHSILNRMCSALRKGMRLCSSLPLESRLETLFPFPFCAQSWRLVFRIFFAFRLSHYNRNSWWKRSSSWPSNGAEATVTDYLVPCSSYKPLM